VPVVPEDKVWHPDYLSRDWLVDYSDDGEYFVHINPDLKGNEWTGCAVSDCYSTEAAAQAAAGRGE